MGSLKFSKEFRERKPSLKELRDLSLCCTQGIRWQEEELALTRGAGNEPVLVGSDLQGSQHGCELARKVGGSPWIILNFTLMNPASRQNVLGKTGREGG